MTAAVTRIPTELRKILLDFTLSCLLEKPSDYVEFGKQYFERLRECRAKGRQIFCPIDDDSDSSEVYKFNMKEFASRRASVLAERYDPDEDQDSDTSVVIPKSDEDRKRLANDIKGVLIFRVLDKVELNKIMDAMSSKLVTKNEVIINQGDTDAQNFYVIEDGSYEAIVKNSSGEQKVVKTYNNVGSFGELALLYNNARAATVRAITSGKLWVLNRETFRKIVVKGAFLKRERYCSLIETVVFLKELNSYSKLDLADSLIPKYYTDGDEIFHQGDVADGMYFIEDGKVNCVVHHPVQGDVLITELMAGSYLGELALITQNRRALTAIAQGDTKLAFLDKLTFERLLGPCTEVLTKHFLDYENRMVEVIGSATSVYFKDVSETEV